MGWGSYEAPDHLLENGGFCYQTLHYLLGVPKFLGRYLFLETEYLEISQVLVYFFLTLFDCTKFPHVTCSWISRVRLSFNYVYSDQPLCIKQLFLWDLGLEITCILWMWFCIGSHLPEEEGEGKPNFQWRQSRICIDLDGTLQWYTVKWQEIKGTIDRIEHKIEFIRSSALLGADKATSHLYKNVMEVPYENGIRQAISLVFSISYISMVVHNMSTYRIWSMWFLLFNTHCWLSVCIMHL